MSWSSPVLGFSKKTSIERSVSPHTHDSVNTEELKSLGDFSVKIGSEISILDWTYSGAFSSSDADTVAWATGTLRFTNGAEYTIAAGDTGNMVARTYVYFDLNVSLTAFTTSTTRSDAIARGKVLIAIAENATTRASFVKRNDNELNLTVTTVNATLGTIGGFDIGSDYIRDIANSFGLASTVTGGDDVRFWAGDTFANRATAPFRTTEAGAVTATSIAISTSSSTIAGTSLINSVAASVVQERAEALYKKIIFIGHTNDGLSTTGSNGGVTRYVATTRIGTNNIIDNAYGILYSGQIGQDGAFDPTDWDDDYEMDILVDFSGTTSQDIFFGLVNIALWGGAIPDGGTSVDRHVGFYIDDAIIYASNADGTTQTRTDVSAGITMTNENRYRFVYDGGVNIKFYINDTLVSTSTTNMPSGATNVPNFYVNVTNSGPVLRQIRINNNYKLSVTI